MTWHDGAPFTADDVAFTKRLNTVASEWGLSVSARLTGDDFQEHALADSVEAFDPQTVLIRWKQPFLMAGSPRMRPVARHILEPLMQPSQPDLLGSSRYWTTEQVGLGSLPPGAMGGRRLPGPAAGNAVRYFHLRRLATTCSGRRACLGHTLEQ